MEFIQLAEFDSTVDGLSLMLETAIGFNDYAHKFVPMEIALLIIEIAKRSPDKPEWFPHGKWAVIQIIQTRIDEELGGLFSNSEDCQ